MERSERDSRERLEILYTVRNSEAFAATIADMGFGGHVHPASSEEVRSFLDTWGAEGPSPGDSIRRLPPTAMDVACEWSMGILTGGSVTVQHFLPNGLGVGRALASIPKATAKTVLRSLLLSYGSADLSGTRDSAPVWVLVDAVEDLDPEAPLYECDVRRSSARS